VNWAKQEPKQRFLDSVLVPFISSGLKNELSVTSAVRLQSNLNLSFQSCELSGKGFIVSQEEAETWIKADDRNRNILKTMLDGKGLTNPNEKLDWVIDFNDLSIEEASEYKLPFQRVREKVKPERDLNKRKARQLNWWQFGEKRPAMRKALQGLTCYFAIPKIVKWVMFTVVNLSILPCEANMVIASDDFYVLGILTSKVHRIWVKAQSSTLEDRTRYTNTTCFETFPFPQLNPNNKNKGLKPLALPQQIRATMQELHQYRSQQMETKQWGITKLYNEYFHEPASQLYKLHTKLDKLVMEAYGFSENDDLLSKLLELNLELAEREKQGLPVIGARSV
jgi:hypothetical protein